MTEQHDDTQGRNRFILMNLARIGATVVVLLAILLWQSDVFVEGGSIIGLPIALIALAVSFLAPKYLARRWRTPPTP
jgi:uncharacterized membrane protein YhaH (DUF805 family)